MYRKGQGWSETGLVSWCEVKEECPEHVRYNPPFDATKTNHDSQGYPGTSVDKNPKYKNLCYVYIKHKHSVVGGGLVFNGSLSTFESLLYLRPALGVDPCFCSCH